MQLKDYLARINLPSADAQNIESRLSAETAKAAAQYRYPVPELGEAGSCSLLGTLADTPYDLAPILGGHSPENEQLLSSLQALTRSTASRLAIDWLGCYLRTNNVNGEPVLVKLAYVGEPSRAEFPLTETFAQLSNNVQVALSGKPRLINDVAEYLEQGGMYYTCDLKVKAEACLPLWDEQGEVIGIVDAESFNRDFFTPEIMTQLAGYCWQVQKALSLV